MKNTIRFLLTATLLFFALTTFAQRGKIITPATPLTNPMNPNGDTWITASGAEFSNDGYNVDEFEFRMFGIPKLGGDVAGDNIGQPCGITDLIPDRDGYSVYAHRDANNNIIFRFRVGSNNPSVEAWTILLDIDNKFGASDPNATTNNPGFEVDITLIKRNNAGVLVYNIDGIESCPQPIKNYPISSHFQIAIADTRACNDADYFYDFYVPFEEIAAIFRGLGFDLEPTTGMRYVAVTNVSATCAMAGKIADISGVDYDDYSKNVPGAFTALVEAQCPTAVLDLCETCEGFDTGLLKKPTIETPIRAGQTFVKGTSLPDTYIRLSIFSRIGGTDENPIWSLTPREEKTVLVPASGEWTVNLDGPLLAYDRIVARALKTEDGSGCGDSSGNETSTSITVVDPNVAPVAQDLAITTPEDTPRQFALVATDADNDPITYIIVTQPSHGTVTLVGTGPQVIYTPNLNYFGPDSFTYRASDGILLSNVATVTITVTPVNDPPVANDNAYITNEDTPLSANVSTNDSDVDGPQALYTVITGTTNGTLVLNLDGTFTYTPNANYNGTDQFVYQRCDGGDPNLCAQATVTITVLPVNDPPVANDDSFVIDEDTQLVASVATNDDPTDGPQAIYTVAVQPQHGTLTLLGNGNFTYTPNPNYFGTDQFTYNLCDAAIPSLCDQAVVTISINPVNDPPIAVDDSFTTDENVAIIGASVAGNDSDVDGPEALYSLVSGPANGQLVFNINGTFNYTPNSGFFGIDQFVYRLCDNGTPNLCDEATVTITVNSVNEAPVANDDVFVTDEDVPLIGNVSLNDDETDGPSAVYTLIAGPSNGNVVLNSNGTFTYTPNLNYFGSDQFTYSLCDQGTPNLCDQAVVTITVNPVNDPPIAVDDSFITDENVALVGASVAGNDSDVDGPQALYTLVSGPANGQLIFNVNGTFTYTPNAGYFGGDQFIYRLCDNGTPNLCDEATVTITINSVNDPPVANDDVFVTDEDVPLNGDVSLNDDATDGPSAVYAVVSGPSNGNLVLNSNGTFTYTPNLNYFGSDQFTYSLCDQGTPNLCDQAVVSITINPLNDPPVIIGKTTPTFFVAGGVIIDNTLTVTDVDNPTIVSVIATISDNFEAGDILLFTNQNGITGSYNPATGVLTMTGTATLANYTNALRSIVFDDSNNGSFKTRRITFIANDGQLNSAPWNSFIDYPGNNGDPRLNPNNPDADKFVTPEDTPFTACLDVEDPDGDQVVISGFGSTPNGTFTFSGNDACFTFTPALNFNGVINTTVTICDVVTAPDVSRCVTIPITITVTPVNDAPVAQNQVVTVTEDTPKEIILTATDVDNAQSELTFEILTQPVHGTLTGSGSTWTYTPNADYTGPDSFTFRANDGSLNSNTATVSINVIPVNDAPVAIDQVVTVIEDTPKAITLTATDIDTPQGNLIFTIVTQPQHGTLTGAGNSWTYTPDPDYNGPDSFTFIVNDGDSDSNIATVSINVVPVNDPPVVVSKIIEIDEDNSVRVCIEFTDAEGDPAFISSLIPQNNNGTIQLDPASGALCFIFTPNPNFNGTEIIDIIICDPDDPTVCGTGTITIIVKPVNDPPVIVVGNVPVDSLFFTTPEDIPLNFCFDAEDVDGDNLSFSSLVNRQGGGSLVYDPNSAFCFTFTPLANFNGRSIWEATICDDGTPTLCGKVIIVIDVTPVNDPPVVVSKIIETDEDTPVRVCIEYTDPEGDPAFISSLILQGNSGTVVLDPGTSAPGAPPDPGSELCFIYTPNPNFNGQDIIDIIICDPLQPSVCGSGTVTIIVRPVNDPPVIVVGGVPVDSLFLTTIEDTPVNFCFDADDLDGDNLSFGTVTNMQGGGTLVYDPNSAFCFTFTPAPNFFGRAIWEITVCDDGTPSLCGKVIVVIDVTPVDDPPVAFDQVVEVIEDTPKEIILQASDPDNDPLTYTVLTQPAHGLLTGIAPNLTYSPAQDYNGPDAFTFRVNDGTSNSNIATVTINVIPVNDPPVLTILPVLFAKEDSVLQVCPGVVDVDGDPITYLPATNSKGGGTMPVDDPPFNFCYLFTPPLNYNGESIWQISISDGTVTVSAPVKIIVLPVNDPPVALNDYYTVRSGIDTVFNALDNDLPIVAPFKEFYDIYEADSVDVLRVTEIEAGPYHGTLTFQSDGRMNYRSNFGYQGADSVRYKMCDSGNLCETAVVFITVTPAPFKVWQALSPNGDGLNDYWRIDGIEAYPNNKVQVFDRYGNLVFETRGYLNADSPGSNGSSNNYWRGQANKGLIGGSLPDGTYFYAIDLGNGTPVLSGYVVLKLN